MLKPFETVAGVMVTVLLLPGCTASGDTGSFHVVPPCSRALAVVRELGLDTGPFVSVTSYASLGAAGRKLVALGPERASAEKALTRLLDIGSRESVASIQRRLRPYPPLLNREMRRVMTDERAFEAAVGAYYRHRGKAQGIGKAARQIMQDIQAVQATCSRKHA